MFLAIRELKFARGRFALIITVVTLMTLLVGFLTGLSLGLASQNISALLNTNANTVIFNPASNGKASYSTSKLDAQQVAHWQTYGAVPVGISDVLLANGKKTTAAAIFAADQLAPKILDTDEIVLSQGVAKELNLTTGKTLKLAGSKLTVAAVVADAYYAHRLVVWTNLATWHDYLAQTRQPATAATVMLLPDLAKFTAADKTQQLAQVARDTATVTQPLLQSLLLLESFKAEIGSLGMMISMLVLITTLVIGVFFLVWALQRQRDIAVLKALGAKTSWLAFDALGQALLVLLIGVGLGTLATLGLGALVAPTMPFVTGTLALTIPGVFITLSGLLGALVSVYQITRVDPNTALQAANS